VTYDSLIGAWQAAVVPLALAWIVLVLALIRDWRRKR
jgi:hypothetical protein